MAAVSLKLNRVLKILSPFERVFKFKFSTIPCNISNQISNKHTLGGGSEVSANGLRAAGRAAR